MAAYISERKAGQVIADSVRLYRDNFLILFLIYALPLLPVMLIMAQSTTVEDESLSLLADLLNALISIFTIGALTFAVSEICVGNRPRFVRSYAAIWQVLWAYVGTYLIYLIAFFGGLVLLIVPGLIAGTALLFSLPVCIIEKRSAIQSCKRSIALGKGFYLRNLGIVLLVLIVFGVTVELAAVLLGGIAGYFFGTDETALFFALIVFFLLALAVGPLIIIPMILLYYDMRARKEHFDGAALAQELMS